MASSMARDGRRRRVLNDEVRSAAGALSAFTSGLSPAVGVDAPRYGEQANIEHHPQITDFVPRRKRTVLTAIALGGGVAVGTQFLAQHATTLAAIMPGVPAQQVASQLAYGLAVWTSVVALLLVAVLARVIYSLRRHRVDDVRGRYRVWRWIAAGALAGSLNAIVGVHQVVGRAAATITGWSLTSTASEWWLAPLALVGGWVGLRLAFEISESRSALALALLTGATYALAAAGALGWSLTSLGASPEVLTGALPLVGHTLMLAAMMVFARYVVLDVQGLIEHKPRRPAASAAKARKAAARTTAAPATTAPLAAGGLAASAKTPTPPTKTASTSSSAASWNDADENADDDNDGNRRLSKAERKRLRKQGRAA